MAIRLLVVATGLLISLPAWCQGEPSERSEAVRRLLKGDDGTVVRANLEWLTDEDDDIRLWAAKALAESARPDDEGRLRECLGDESTYVRYWGMRGMLALEPADLDDILRELSFDGAFEQWPEATLELARRGDEEALRELVEWVDERPPDRYMLWLACDVLAEKHPLGALEALRKATASVQQLWDLAMEEYPDPVDFTRQTVSMQETLGCLYGALAALGDQDALPILRQLATEGEPLRRRPAIEWLGKCEDRESIPQLQAWTAGGDRFVSEAARSALAAMSVEVVPPPHGLPPASPSATGWDPGVPLGRLVGLAGALLILLSGAGGFLVQRRGR